MNRVGVCASVLCVCAGGVIGAGPTDVADMNDGDMAHVHGCFGDDHGHLSGGIFAVPQDEEVQEIISAVQRANRGTPDNRLDLVFVGDGYTAGEMGQYHTDVQGIVDSLYAFEPFTTYQSYFRVTPVEVVSNESGVDNDPSQGIDRDTALDMNYWCSGIERLLCVNVGKAYNAAAVAPDIDQVIAISNSSKYGGAGYSSNNLGTAAGQNGAAADIAIHELGHSLGDLADEYTYGGSETYNGAELGPVNVSIYDTAEQAALNTKWNNWDGTSMPSFDNPIGTYEGGNYSVFGVYRPSNNSMMRSLGRPFNLVSAEQLIKEIYREVNPIDGGTSDGTVLPRNGSATVVPMQPIDHELTVEWSIDGVHNEALDGMTTIDISSLGLDNSAHTIRVSVVDNTPWVRNESIRNQFMSAFREFSVAEASCAADINGDGSLNFFDVSMFLERFGAGDLSVDFTNDGSLNFFDVSAFLAAFGEGCP